MLSTDHDYYLNAMGITRWRRRGVALQQFHVCKVMGDAGAVGLFVARTIAEGDALQKEQDLLVAIAKALKLTLQHSIDAQPPSASDFSGVKFVVAFDVSMKPFGSPMLVETHAISELLAQPKLKADTWKALQPVVGLLAS